MSIASRIVFGWLLHPAVEQLWAPTDDMVTNRQAVSRVISFAKSFIEIPCSWVHYLIPAVREKVSKITLLFGDIVLL